MASVSVNPPKTPATTGSNGTAAATVPNVCKMPGPPAPFVPTPLPNIGKTSISPTGYSKTVKIEGHAVAIRGASFGSTGDAASKGTGGGVVSSNTHGPTKFIGPGSLNVKFEGKNVHFLGDPMMNNCGPGGSPANSATLAGLAQPPSGPFPRKSDPTCPHTNMWRSPPEEEADRRKQLESSRQWDLARSGFSNWVIRQANKGRLGVRETTRLLDQCNGSEVNARTAAFEQRVAKETHAKETSIQYCCLDCGINGDIDVVTEEGVVKECKISNKAASQKQIEKLHRIVTVLFPGSPLHFALPASEAAVAKGWMNTPPNHVQAH